MDSKVRVVHHSKTIGYSGTDRTAQLFVKYLNQDPRFEAFLVYQENGDTSRLEECKKTIGEQFLVPYQHTHRKNPSSPYLPATDNLFEVLEGIGPSIFHVHNSGYAEWPAMKYLAPKAKLVQTNIFGNVDNRRQAHKVIYISEFIRNLAMLRGGPDGPVLYNPIDPPLCIDRNAARADMLRRHGLHDDAVLMGRVGRADNFDPVALRALKLLQDEGDTRIHYLVVNGCDGWFDLVRKLDIKRVKFLSPIINDYELSLFYSALDIYGHARSDGEACPCNIQEAMIHGVPVISGMGHTYHGQIELLEGCGFVVGSGDYVGYAKSISEALESREALSAKARNKALDQFSGTNVVTRLADIYLSLI